MSKCIIKNLNSGKDFYKYSEQIETEIANLIGKATNTLPTNITEGFNPKYDFKLNNKKIELKITSQSQPSIEFARGNGKVSGLLLSEADYYIILSPGGSKGKFVGKFRMYSTDDLKAQMIVHLLNNSIHTYPITPNSPGSMCYKLSPKTADIDDYWLGDCDLIIENGSVVGFDLSTYQPSYYNFINKAKITLQG
jgi:hypothetical protein